MTHQRWEQIVRADKMVPAAKKQRGDILIYVAASNDLRTDRQEEFPSGYYKAIWAVGDANALEIAQPMEFDALHDVESLPVASRHTARVNRAVAEADKFIMACRRDGGEGKYARQ